MTIIFDVIYREFCSARLAEMRKQLLPDGYLFLGGAESTMNIDNAFERAPFERAGCYRIVR